MSENKTPELPRYWRWLAASCKSYIHGAVYDRSIAIRASLDNDGWIYISKSENENAEPWKPEPFDYVRLTGSVYILIDRITGGEWNALLDNTKQRVIIHCHDDQLIPVLHHVPHKLNLTDDVDKKTLTLKLEPKLEFVSSRDGNGRLPEDAALFRAAKLAKVRVPGDDWADGDIRAFCANHQEEMVQQLAFIKLGMRAGEDFRNTPIVPLRDAYRQYMTTTIEEKKDRG